jgi:hypothetical protein
MVRFVVCALILFGTQSQVLAQCSSCSFTFTRPHQLDLFVGGQGPFYGTDCTGHLQNGLSFTNRSNVHGWTTAGFPCTGPALCGTTGTGTAMYTGSYHSDPGYYTCCVSAYVVDSGSKSVPVCSSPGTCPTVTDTYGSTIYWEILFAPTLCPT